MADQSVTLITGATLNSRALARNTAVTLDTNVVTKPAADIKLAFGVQPINTVAGGTITPAVTVRIFDANNNLVTSDTRDVTLAIVGHKLGV